MIHQHIMALMSLITEVIQIIQLVIINKIYGEITLVDMLIIRMLQKQIRVFQYFELMFSYGAPPQNYPQYGGAYPADNGYGANRNRGGGGGGGNNGGGGGGYNPSLQHSGPVTTTQVTIPTEMAGKRIHLNDLFVNSCVVV
jgi:hypothetical protein